MTKEEIIQAIDETIVPNNKKAITATSMANILRELASVSGKGASGDEILRLHLPVMSLLGIGLSEWNPTVLEEIILEVEQSMPNARESLFYTLLSESFELNAQVYRTIKERGSKGEGALVVADFSRFNIGYLDWQSSFFEPILGFDAVESVGYLCTAPLLTVSGDVVLTQEGIDQGLVDEDTLSLINSCVFYNSVPVEGLLDENQMIWLNEDGTLIFENAYLSPPKLEICIPEDMTSTLSWSFKAANARFFEKCSDWVGYTNVIPTTIDILHIADNGETFMTYNKSFLEVYIQDDYFEGTILKDLTLYKIRVTSVGELAITAIGTI